MITGRLVAGDLFVASLVLLCAVCCGVGDAHAGRGLIGAHETTHHLQNAKMKGPQGQHLFVGYRLRTVGLIVPFYALNKGYVLGIHGSNGGGYLEMPKDPELRRLQTEGLLPSHCPRMRDPY